MTKHNVSDKAAEHFTTLDGIKCANIDEADFFNDMELRFAIWASWITSPCDGHSPETCDYQERIAYEFGEMLHRYDHYTETV